MSFLRNNIFYTITVIIIVFVVPLELYGASLDFRLVPHNIVNDHATVIEVYIDSEDETLNVVEGVIHFSDLNTSLVSAVLVETGSSVVDFWTEKPSFFVDDTVIRFSGGSISGFEGEHFLFRMRMFFEDAEEFDLRLLSGKAHRSDGLGTEVYLGSKSLHVLAGPSVPKIISNSSFDSTPPDIGSIEIGQDEHTYDGQVFVHVMGRDNISGISHFVFDEGGVSTRSENGLYIFIDQSKQTPVSVTVYDNAGNSRSMGIDPNHKDAKTGSILTLFLILLGILIVRYVYQTQK